MVHQATAPKTTGGLDGVVASLSSVSSIDGETLRYRGYSIEDLAGNSSFEEVAYLLWYGSLPAPAALESLRRELRANYVLPTPVQRSLLAMPLGGATNAMSVLRTAVSWLSLFDPEENAMSREANLRKAARLTARMPAILATYRVRGRSEPPIPNADRGIAGSFLEMLRGSEPSERESRVLDIALVLLADHELNASTFAARVAASTLTDIYSAVTAAIAALKGPLHGGASQQVVTMFEQIGDPLRTEAWVDATLANRQRIMGFGHRVYRQGDPRAEILKQLIGELTAGGVAGQWYETAKRLEEAVGQRSGLRPNVDLYLPALYQALSVPSDLFTPIFALSRVVGWTAHIIEQYENNRLIRPRAEYVGAAPQQWIPLPERSPG
jgi:2-methylcitrate synthase